MKELAGWVIVIIVTLGLFFLLALYEVGYRALEPCKLDSG